MKDLRNVRNEYKQKPLDDHMMDSNPMNEFHKWFELVLESYVHEPTAMVLSTIGSAGFPENRIVLLKELRDEGFVFYTNYDSAKGNEIEKNNKVGLNFFWSTLERQVRVTGYIEKVSEEDSDAYYNSRPYSSQVTAWASPQSQKVGSRSFLVNEASRYREKFHPVGIPRPKFWGGYIVKPEKIEFWQGRADRLHDRIVYEKKREGIWKTYRLAP